ncbi:hypothetical protein HOY80DRAFT_1134286 [Tuber brumale]|nr:hypothetical protein HOY80DRAFT_1134286 [Tuber brumale]
MAALNKFLASGPLIVMLAGFGGNLVVVIQRRYTHPPRIREQALHENQRTTNTNPSSGGTE